MWEPETLAVLNTFVDTDTVVLDIGAWIGPVTIIAARKASRVIAYEPDPHAFKVLQANVLLNGCTNVSCIAAAITDRDGTALLRGGSGRTKFGCSTSRVPLSSEEHGECIKVPSCRLDQAVERIALSRSEKLFIKMDIEGGEGLAIPTADLAWTSTRPTLLLLSVHASLMGAQLSNRVVRHLINHSGVDQARVISWDTGARRARLTPLEPPLTANFAGSLLFGFGPWSFPTGLLPAM